METINRQAKTLARWEEILMPIEVEALHDTYHTNPEETLTPNEVLDIIRWSQEVHMMQLQRVIDLGKFRKNDGSLRNLRASCACSKALRRFLGRRETKLDRRAAELLESLERS